MTFTHRDIEITISATGWFECTIDDPRDPEAKGTRVSDMTLQAVHERIDKILNNRAKMRFKRVKAVQVMTDSIRVGDITSITSRGTPRFAREERYSFDGLYHYDEAELVTITALDQQRDALTDQIKAETRRLKTALRPVTREDVEVPE